MQVILTQNVPKLGQAYDVVTVKTGYARNFLFPQNLAAIATPTLRKKAEKVKEERVQKLEETKAKASEMVKKLKDVVLTVAMKAKDGKLYAGVHEKDVVEALTKQEKIEVSKDMVKIKDSIKEVGEHVVTLHLAEDTDVKIKINVEASS